MCSTLVTVQERCIESMNAHLCVFARVLTSSPLLSSIYFPFAPSSLPSSVENLSLSALFTDGFALWNRSPSVQWFKYENFGTLIEYTAARVYVPRLIVLLAYLFNFKPVPNQGLNNKSAWLIVQSFKARVYVQFLACKTAERLTGRLCITKFQNC